MRIDRLVVEGFGPFARRQEVDFAALADAGLFLITGRTGSGKSSVLDAVCFALYGSAPRYEGGQQRLRSDHAAPDAPTSVELEFTIRQERWRVRRSPEHDRPKRRGGGTTRAAAAATLERFDDGAWVGVAARPVDVAEHLAPVLQLTREQFLQVILLAQGRFQEFLRARSEDRLGLLRTLFGTDRFARFEAELAERARTLDDEVDAERVAAAQQAQRIADAVGEDPPEHPDAGWAGAAVERLGARLAGAAAEERRTGTAFEAADAAAAGAVALADRQQRRAAARERLATATAAAAASVGDAERLELAIAAAPLVPVVDEADRAVDLAERRRRALLAARSAAGAEVADAQAASADLDRLLGALGPAADEERRLPSLAASAAAAGAEEERAAAALAAAAEATRLLPTRAAQLQDDRASLSAVAADAPAAAARLAQAERVAAAAEAARSAAERVPALEAALLQALDAEAAAVALVRSVVAARLGDVAASLAADLVDGVPCAVCGATDHPAPARRAAGDAPDESAVTAADARRDAAGRRRETAATALADARSARDTAAAVAAGADVPAAAAALVAAREAVAEAARATADLRTVEAELARTASAIAAADDRSAALRAALGDAAATRVRAAQEAAAAQDRVAGARDGAPSVQARIDAAVRRRDLLRALAGAEREDRDAVAAAQQAAARLGAALAGSGFAAAAAVRAAAVPAAERTALRERLEAIGRARDAAAAQLADPELAAAPEEPADVAGTAAAKAAALAERDAAADARAWAARRADEGRAAVDAFLRIEARVADARERLAVVGPLAEVVRGEGSNDRRMRLESYVLAARLEQIVAAANARLTVMSDGRFTLRHDDAVAYRGARSGLGLEVLDEHTGRPRPVASLSGGETFLASLALALGLAEVVAAEAGGVRLDTLFIDEGFGSLDRQTLDTAMETLDSLRSGGRTVGLISHVEAMQEDVPAGLHVERGPDGTSSIRRRTTP